MNIYFCFLMFKFIFVLKLLQIIMVCVELYAHLM